jgi:two-component system invasion response regulator UvrY
MNNSTIVVAIADDHSLYREAVARVINSNARYKVVFEAKNGKELLEKLTEEEETQELPSIILLDINMPVMDGFETMAVLKVKYPSIKVISLSGYSNSISVLQMYKCGAHGFLSKTAEGPDVFKALEQVLRTGYFFPDGTLQKDRDSHSSSIVENIKELSEKELAFIKYACTELSYKQMAEKMHVSPHTIDDYRARLFKKLNVQSRTALAMMAVKYKIVEASNFLPGEDM